MAYESDPGWRFLKQPTEEALADQAKRFDSKTHVWIPDMEEGFIAAEIKSSDENKYTVLTVKGEEKTLAKVDTQEMNPPKYDKLEDMSNMTFLNEASVLDNLRQRYFVMLIYTYSGLFCVVINPYKRLPIYTESVVKMYQGKRRNEMPPHLFAVADQAYRNMLDDKENQSMLITGESGAGKTENTKKVISYFALVGATSSKEPTKKGASLEEQIVQTNPVLEAFGNAKTVRNNNSSRFGKFIRTHFNSAGKLAGGDIEHYLLEKSRVIKQAPGERCYHIFYQIMSGHIKGLKDSLGINKDLESFSSISQAELTIEGVNDAEEMGLTDEAFDIMGFEQVEKDSLFKLCAAIMHMGEMKFKQKPRDEQAESDGTEEAELACKLYGVDSEKFLKALLSPRVKVGTEWVNKGQNLEQVGWSVGALSKAVYARMFSWLIKRCNKTLDAHDLKRERFIGVLDIAGFEIFDFNSFEQLWINFVNEKLQQFFNHHMFVLEQEEYKREGIQWEFIDFGLDLQACIELIEKPLGIISMLDEECIVPKATDLTFVQKLNDQHLGKHPNLQKPKPPKGKQADAHFACVHYAGTVRYNVTAWLEKNKDPLNDSVVAVLKTSEDNQLLKDIWADYQTQEDAAKLAEAGKAAPGKKKGKSGSMQTVSVLYRESLNNLMTMLHKTHPHFIRCIIPNEQKKSGLIEAGLVLNQLTCNGVLEGIRICRKGFPNRLVYADFRHRYAILAPAEAADSDVKKAAEKMMKRLENEKKLTEEQYRLGLTKVFFKAGVLALMEELRDEALSQIITKFQCACRSYLAQCEYKHRLDRMGAYLVIQRNVKVWCTVRSWGWYLLFTKVKPLLKGDKRKEELEELQQKVEMLEQSLGVEITKRTNAEKENANLKTVNEEITASLEKETTARKELQKENEGLNEKVSDLEQAKTQLTTAKQKLESLNATLKLNNEELDAGLKKSTADGKQKDNQIRSLHDEMTQQDSLIAKLNQDRKVQETVNRDLSENLNSEVAKTERLENLRNKLETTLDEMEKNYDVEKKNKAEVERAKKKVESELRAAHEKIDELRLQKNDLENYLKKKEAEVASLKNRMDDDQNMVAKLQLHIRELQQRIGDLEEEIENEHRGRSRAEKLKGDLQEELDQVSMRLEEANGSLTTQLHLNKQRSAEVSRLYHELEARNINHETHINELCNLQWTTLSNFRDLSTKAGLLESEVGQLLDQVKTQKESKPRRIFRADTGSDGVARSASQAQVELRDTARDHT